MTAVVVPDLNAVGRLGNQLWRAAAAIGVAKAHGVDVALPTDWDYRPWLSIPDEFYGPQVGTHVNTFASHLDERARPYLQDLSLFAGATDMIRLWFRPSPAALEVLDQHRWIDELPRPRVALQVRRGDNVTHPSGYHPLRSMQYYRDALALIPDAQAVVVFSDDIPWCRANLPGELGLPTPGSPRSGARVWFFDAGVTRPREYIDRVAYRASPVMDWVDVQLMARLERHILSNSTFAWWGAFLSEDPQPIYPSNWFGWRIAGYTDASLMMPPNWVEAHDETQGGARR